MRAPRGKTWVRRVRAWSVLLVLLWPAPRAATQSVAAGAPARATAILAPRRQAVLATEVSGRVVRIRRELGEAFAVSEPLVQVDEISYRVARDLAAAELAAAEAERAQVEQLTHLQTRQRHAAAALAAARANLAAVQKLFDDGHASAVDLENARRDVTTAETDAELVAVTAAREQSKAARDLAVAQGRHELAVRDLAACVVAAPYAGQVARVLVREQEWVERGTPVLEIVDADVLRARFLLPSAQFRAVQVGQRLPLNVAETGETVEMTVTQVAAVLDPASVTCEVYAEVDNRDGRLRAGMNGWVVTGALAGAGHE
jgi:multidrug resistance efflux pump